MEDYKNNTPEQSNQPLNNGVADSAERTVNEPLTENTAFSNSESNSENNSASNFASNPSQTNAANSPLNTGFYSYKYPNTANDPSYSATTQPTAQAAANQNQQSSPYSNPQSNAQSEYSAPNDTHYQNPQYSAYQPYSQYGQTPPTPPISVKPKKDKRKYPLSALIACCLGCAIIASGITTAGVAIAGNYLDLSSGSDSASGSGTVINVDKTTTSAVSAVAEKVVPSVVGIRVTSSVVSYFGMMQDASSEGSGVIYTSDGYIITNYHVISSYVEASSKSSATISVYLAADPETAIDATVVGYNSESDLAVIKIEKKGLTVIEFEDSDNLEVGELAVAVGNPGGLSYMSSVSSGIISGLNRTLKLEGITQMKLIQTDAAINPGNSGGALCSAEGKLVGINSSKISSTEYEGMGFAIPANYVKTITDNIINNKDVKKAYLGVKISTDYSSETLQAYGYPAGAVVESVDEDSPAETAGIKQYDIITAFDGVEVSDYSGYNTERLKHSPGDTVSLRIFRNGSYYDVSLTLGESTN